MSLVVFVWPEILVDRGSQLHGGIYSQWNKFAKSSLNFPVALQKSNDASGDAICWFVSVGVLH